MANLPETPQWESGIYQIEVSDPVLGGPDGISNRQAKQLASRTSYLKQKVEKSGTDLAAHIAAVDPHTQYATKASPTFTGTPTAPTPANGDNSKKLATTEFVAKALAALAGSAPETLDTLKELADALGNDPNFATTVLNKLAEKLAKDQNGADIPEPALFVKNLGLGEGSALPVGVPVPWPSATLPEGWLKCNGAAFSSEMYPKLAKAYPANKLPDLRGEFIRGWDDGRGIDAARALLSIQNGMLEKHRHIVVANDGYDTKDEWELATIFKKTYTQGRGLDATNTGGSLIPSPTLHSRGSIGNTGGSETRPRNIAFNYIVRAA
ncbi:TPA: tail fiber protein [Salmonella enterica subsp. enterica serovar Typhi]|uniref:Phage tail protein n=40 Tax=Salmonella TaxID=590 RepID=A0A3Y8NDI0_SALET|nr:phage tail protein [Salmonella enterica]EHQ7273574.1 tail fiber protein [Salmonella enterica subsp. enterica]MDK9589907.1 tail fiber protein [Salmonella enterica subsp. enterica serovar Typhimurium]HAD4385674.1 phage tail protein [Salmonella enterica subsp. enterica serovar Typhi str. CT18]HCG3556780.1 tail fiber protein [Salmonella enterica subsp. enterica serovar Typhi str. AG3]AEZ45140.1 bacteriophage tail fiber protein [Salmonella enterica subsp. enterica serovar Typhi str. P-stx-12]